MHKGATQKTKANHLTVGIVSALLSFMTFTASANPTGGQVNAGTATIDQSQANQTTITQSTNKAVIDWQSFNIANHETTQFIQPDGSSVTLNRINPSNGVSNIFGNLKANGQVWLINPAGIFFGPTARVDVGGLLATTANISNEDFMSQGAVGHPYTFNQYINGAGAVINAGHITASEGGMVALVAPAVANSGLIQARLGKVTLAAGNAYTLDFYGDQLINFGTSAPVSQATHDQNGNVLKDAVNNSGTILADGGTIVMTAHVAKGVVDNAINMNGIAEAKAVVQKGGTIYLLGGEEGIVKVSGKLDVSGKNTGQTGGKIVVTGNRTALDAGAQIDASGDSGGGEVLIGGDAHGAQVIGENSKRTYVDPEAFITADAIVNGNGGKVVIWADEATGFYGNITARGGLLGGDGGFVEVSGKQILDYLGKVNTSAALGKTGTLLLDPHSIIIQTAGGILYEDNMNNRFNNLVGSDVTLTPASIIAEALADNNIILQANTDITFAEDLALGNMNGNTFTVEAGRSIIIQDNVTISMTNGTMYFNANSNGADLLDRAGGTAVFSMGAGSQISTNGAIQIALQDNGLTAGDVTLADIFAEHADIFNDVADIVFNNTQSTGVLSANAQGVISGTITGDVIGLNGIGGINNVSVTADSLTLSGQNGGSGSGTINGQSGDAAAQAVQMGEFSNGNFTFNGCTLPCVSSSSDTTASSSDVQPQEILPETETTINTNDKTTADITVDDDNTAASSASEEKQQGSAASAAANQAAQHAATALANSMNSGLLNHVAKTMIQQPVAVAQEVVAMSEKETIAKAGGGAVVIALSALAAVAGHAFSAVGGGLNTMADSVSHRSTRFELFERAVNDKLNSFK